MDAKDAITALRNALHELERVQDALAADPDTLLAAYLGNATTAARRALRRAEELHLQGMAQ